MNAPLVLLLALAPAPTGERGGVPSPRIEAIADAARWLWSRQREDGGWHSETYGLLRSGQSLTPFVLHALLEVPEEVLPLPRERVERALAFIRERVDADGALGRKERLHEDYPNYATSLAVLCFGRARPEGWRETVAPLVACLVRQQFTEEKGWTPDHPAFGGWGMGGRTRSFPEPGHVDLSMTRFVLQALEAGGVPARHPSFARARRFLERCQRERSGFIFSPVVSAANKAGGEEEGLPPYGTPTADGVLALVSTGAGLDDPMLAGAVEWLVRNHRDDRVPGIPETAPNDWGKGMRFYYSAATAEAFSRLGLGPEGWRERLVATLLGERRADGSFANADPIGKEDDPLISTPFALLALLRGGHPVQRDCAGG